METLHRPTEAVLGHEAHGKLSEAQVIEQLGSARRGNNEEMKRLTAMLETAGDRHTQDRLRAQIGDLQLTGDAMAIVRGDLTRGSDVRGLHVRYMQLDRASEGHHGHVSKAELIRRQHRTRLLRAQQGIVEQAAHAMGVKLG